MTIGIVISYFKISLLSSQHNINTNIKQYQVLFHRLVYIALNVALRHHRDQKYGSTNMASVQTVS